MCVCVCVRARARARACVCVVFCQYCISEISLVESMPVSSLQLIQDYLIIHPINSRSVAKCGHILNFSVNYDLKIIAQNKMGHTT